MTPRATAIVVAFVILLLGVAGLIYPERVLGLLGFAVQNPAHAAAAMGEVRATYGGLFVVMGLAALLAAFDPVTNRGRLRLIGLLWLGACSGRLLGVYLDGNPGLPGWGAVAFELMIGGALVVAAERAPVVFHEAPMAAAVPPPAAAPPAP
jgi:drug/metabolite transporter superfamily protein YnfA